MCISLCLAWRDPKPQSIAYSQFTLFSADSIFHHSYQPRKLSRNDFRAHQGTMCPDPRLHLLHLHTPLLMLDIFLHDCYCAFIKIISINRLATESNTTWSVKVLPPGEGPQWKLSITLSAVKRLFLLRTTISSRNERVLPTATVLVSHFEFLKSNSRSCNRPGSYACTLKSHRGKLCETKSIIETLKTQMKELSDKLKSN